MKYFQQNKWVPLVIILAIGAVLRFFNWFSLPFTHDEISGLIRLNYNTFADVINIGVKELDTHPPGFHIFLYFYTLLVGFEPWVVKLPTLVLGVWSIYLVYVLGKRFFNENAGLFSATLMAVLQYPVVQSQIARPYGFGIAFVLLFVYFWERILIAGQEKSKYYIGFVLSAIVCAYTHHFSLLFVAIVGISGLFFVSRKMLVRYVLSGVVIGILYVPNLSIFFFQLNKGGIEGWLGKFEFSYIFDYLAYAFNFSWLIVIAIVVGVFIRFSLEGKLKIKTLLLLWFLLPFIIGGTYSFFFNNVVHERVLYFSFPFLLLFLGAFIGNKKPVVVPVFVIAVLGVYSLFQERSHYELFKANRYKCVIENAHVYAKGVDGSIAYLTATKEETTNFYYEKLGYDSIVNAVDVYGLGSVQALLEYVGTCSAEYLYFGSSQVYNPVYLSVIKEFYPIILKYDNSVSLETFLLKKGDVSKKWPDKISEFGYWASNEYLPKGCDAYYDDSVCGLGAITKQPYFGTISYVLDTVLQNDYNMIELEFELQQKDSIGGAQLVSSIEKEGKTYDWRSIELSEFDIDNKKGKILYTIKVPDIKFPKGAVHKIYIWNKNKSSYVLYSAKVIVRKGNAYIYADTHKIDM
jgi:hypothetical protein